VGELADARLEIGDHLGREGAVYQVAQAGVVRGVGEDHHGRRAALDLGVVEAGRGEELGMHEGEDHVFVAAQGVEP